MQQATTWWRSGRRTSRTLVVSAIAALAAAGCNSDRTATQPDLPGNPGQNPQIRSAAFIMDVNTKTGQVRITPPTARSVDGLDVNPGVSSGFSASASAIGPEFSIIAGDVVELTASNYSASAVGEFQPGRIRVAFDVNISNRLGSVELITPTFPVPPAGTDGIILFPFETVVTTTTGGVGVGGDGTDVIIEQPNRGQVGASIEFGGDPFNFFNDSGCPAGSNDCYRFETFTQPLAAGSTSEARRVGFDIDPTVANFRARLIVAADLRNAGAAPTGSVAGTVSSPQLGGLSGVLVTVQTGGFTGTTVAGGGYSIPAVTTGSKTVTLSNLPAGCTNPGAQTTTVPNGGTATVNFTVQCSVPAGTIAGIITRSFDGAPLAGVTISATPDGGSLVGPSAPSSGTGSYTLAGVPVNVSGDGILTLGNLPANCAADPGTRSYTGLTSGETQTENVTVLCDAPPEGYQYTSTWGPVTAGQVTLTVRIDMGSFNDPAVNGAGADDILTISGSITYNAALLSFGSGGNVSGSTLGNAATNGATAGIVHFTNFTTAGLATGLQGILQITFNVTSPGSVTTGTTITEAVSNGEVDLRPRIIINEGTIILP